MTAYVAGRPVPPTMFGRLVESTSWRGNPLLLRRGLEKDGYVFLRRALNRQSVLEARREVLGRLAEVGEIAEPVEEGIVTGSSRRAELHPDLGAFWRSVSEGERLRRVTHGGALAEIAHSILGKRAKPFDFLWLRTMVGGRTTPLHFDHAYMNRGTAHVISAWVPLGDVPIEAGPIVFVENSHRLDELAAAYRGLDVDRDPKSPGSFADDAIVVAERYRTRLLSAEFEAGDVVLFGMFALHGSLDNRRPGNRLRLSCDVRYQPADEAMDERWFGAPPPAHGGKSYGGINAAQPLGSPGIAR
jgi:hypothetical protein